MCRKIIRGKIYPAIISGKSYGLGARDLAKSAGASLRMQAPISQLSSGLKNVEKFNRKTE
jgi:hypothetical protein